MTQKYTCPVCDYPDLQEEPYYTYEICPQCNIEFGIEDSGTGSDGKPWTKDCEGRKALLKMLRERYLKTGSLTIKVVLAGDEFFEALAKPHLCIGMYIDCHAITCISGDLIKYTFPSGLFQPNSKTSPDFNKPAVIDCGHTLVFGDYQADFSGILQDISGFVKKQTLLY